LRSQDININLKALFRTWQGGTPKTCLQLKLACILATISLRLAGEPFDQEKEKGRWRLGLNELGGRATCFNHHFYIVFLSFSLFSLSKTFPPSITLTMAGASTHINHCLGPWASDNLHSSIHSLVCARDYAWLHNFIVQKNKQMACVCIPSLVSSLCGVSRTGIPSLSHFAVLFHIPYPSPSTSSCFSILLPIPSIRTPVACDSHVSYE
jgi:hypothetical protein